MSKTDQYHITLTNYARGLAQDLSKTLASFLAPETLVIAAAGQYKAFDDVNAFRTVDTSRGVGGAARRLHFAADDPTYNCRPQALEIAIDDHERDEAGESDPLRLEEAKTETLIHTAVLSHEAKVYDAALSGTPVHDTIDLSDEDTDPISQIDEQIHTLTRATGRMPARMVLPIGSWAGMRNHPKIIARFPGAVSIGVSANEFGGMLLNPNIDIRLGILSANQEEALSHDPETINPQDILIFHGSDTPTLYDPSFMKTFRTRRGGVDTVRTYREDSSRSDILALDWTEDIKITSPVSVRRLTVTGA
jgi:hypothetical protein